MTCPAVRELPVLAAGQSVSIKPIFRDVDPNSILHLSFLLLISSFEAWHRAHPPVSVQVDRKDGGEPEPENGS
jgi:hypothetical protein